MGWWRGPFFLLLLHAGGLVAASIEVQWYHDRVSEWTVVQCAESEGPCISFDLLPGSNRLIAVWIEKGSKVSVQLHNMCESPKPYDVWLRTDRIPTAEAHEYHFQKPDAGFAQRACRGSYLYIRVGSTHKTKKQKFGLTFSMDSCRERDYKAPCPVGWTPAPKSYCTPPKGYKGKCAAMNFFGHREGQGGDPMTMPYRQQWARFCGDDWPCNNKIGQHCMPELHYLEGREWVEARCQHSNPCHMTTLQPEGSDARGAALPGEPIFDWQLLVVDVPPGSSVGVELRPDDAGQERQARRGELTLSMRDVPPLVDTGDIQEDDSWGWEDSMRGHSPYVELENRECKNYKKFYLGLYNNGNTAASVTVTLFKLKRPIICRESRKFKDQWELPPTVVSSPAPLKVMNRGGGKKQGSMAEMGGAELDF